MNKLKWVLGMGEREQLTKSLRKRDKPFMVKASYLW
jgi:hypothetical protein